MALSPQESAAYAQMQQVQSDPYMQYLQAVLRGNAAGTIPGKVLAGQSAGASSVAPTPLSLVGVPGQAARQVVAIPPGSPPGSEATIGSSDASDPYGARIQQGFDASAQQPATDPALTQALTGGSDTTTIDDALKALSTGTAGAQPEDRGWLGNMLPEGISNFVADAGTGMAYADPREPASMAFGKAFAGAQASGTARLNRKRADQREMKQEERQAEQDRIAEADRKHRYGQEDTEDSRYWSERAHQAQLEAEARQHQEDQDRAAKEAADPVNANNARLLTEATEAHQQQKKIADALGVPYDLYGDMTKRADLAARQHLKDLSESSYGAVDPSITYDSLFKQYVQAQVDDYKSRVGPAGPSPSDPNASSTAAKGDKAAGTAAPGLVSVDSGTGGPAATEAAAGKTALKPWKDPFADESVGMSAANPLVIPAGQDPHAYTAEVIKARPSGSKLYLQTETGGINVVVVP